MPSYLGLEQKYKDKIPDEYMPLYRESKAECDAYYESFEGHQKCVKWEMNQILHEIESIRQRAKKYKLLDSQEFLDFLDKLNEYSIDPDRD